MPMKLHTFAAGGLLARIAPIALLAIGLATLACLYAAAPSHAVTGSTATFSLANPDAEEETLGGEEEGEEEEIDCEQFERELEEEEIDLEEPCEEGEEGGAETAPPECLLRTASARVFTQTSRKQVSLVLGYTASKPVKVTIDYRLKGAKGALKVGHATRRFSRQGVLRLTDKLSDSQMAKVKAARSFDVSLRVRSAPGYCGSYFARSLTSKRKAHGQLVWGQAKKAGGRRR